MNILILWRLKVQLLKTNKISFDARQSSMAVPLELKFLTKRYNKYLTNLVFSAEIYGP